MLRPLFLTVLGILMALACTSGHATWTPTPVPPTSPPRATLSQADTMSLIDDVLYQAALDAVLVDIPKEIDEIASVQESDYSLDVGEAIYFCDAVDGWISRNNTSYRVISEYPKDSDRRTLVLELSKRYKEQLGKLDRECAVYGW